MEKTIGIILIVCAVANLVLLLVFGIRKKKKDTPSDSNVLSEVETLNDNLNEVKNIVNEHTTREKDNLLSNITNSIKSSNESLAPMLKLYMNMFKEKLDENLATTKDMLSEIRQEMKNATADMSKGTGESLNSLKSETQVALDKMSKTIESSLDRIGNDLKQSLKEVREDNRVQLESVRNNNEVQLQKIRETVEEKLTETLDNRINNAFKIVNESLSKVLQGFGEMRELTGQVSNLNKMFSNVKTIGVWGEVTLESLLDQILSPELYHCQFRLSEKSREMVDFAITMPCQGNEKIYLPIDSKFPLEKYSKFVEASEEGDSVKIDKARRELVDEVKRAAKSISTKYIINMVTTRFAIMYLPIEGLYAEIAKNTALTTEIQNKYNVTICGPTTVTALLNTLQMAFTTIKIQKRSGEIADALQEFQTDFNNYTKLVTTIKKNATNVVETIDKVEKQNRLINQRLSKVVGDLPVDDDKRLIASDEVTED
ncbi:MAG: DNA recombination protein RmuC [Clostridiales bacterium]|nr:DNA recombination protein RmuC [Clostridiales bacterium]